MGIVQQQLEHRKLHEQQVRLGQLLGSEPDGAGGAIFPQPVVSHRPQQLQRLHQRPRGPVHRTAAGGGRGRCCRQLPQDGTNYTSPSEEYFYRSVLDVSSGLDRLGVIKWQMVMCLLLCWIIVFFCLFRGIKSAGKVSYVVALVPYVAVLVLLVRGVTMAGSSNGVNFYTTPKWEQLKQPRMWVDAAAQVFFSLSICWGGLTTLSSYNKFHNNVYRDAILVCLGDTLMSILSGFAVFAMIGVLSDKLGSPVEGVIQSDVGMTFIVYPAALLSFPVPSLWSALFFLMLVTMGLGTTFCTIETVVTAIVDENPAFLKKRRVLMLTAVCVVSFLLGLPCAAQGGLYLLQLMDEYLTGFPLLIAGLCLCLGISGVYGLQRFCNDIQHMTKAKVGVWWKVMWISVTPVVIVFILISCGIGYQSLGKQFDDIRYPWWSEVLGFSLVFVCILPIFAWPMFKVLKGSGPFLKRIQMLCRPDPAWGPALEKNWNYVEYFPAVQTNLLAVEMENPPLNTITGQKAGVNFDWNQSVDEVYPPWQLKVGADRVEFTTVGVRIPSVSQTSLLPLSQHHPGTVRMKSVKTLDMRQKAILNHAYSNPQCNLFYGSAEKLTQGTRVSSSSDGALNDVVVAHRTRLKPEMKDVCTQTDVSCFEKLKRQVSEPIGRATTPPSPAPSLSRSMSWMHEGEPAVIEVEVTKF
ncbi:sodium-dependent proline transporter-like isoform X1 [Pomacea canaliculata]|uniref:sodium-dependent proline transporter-like isoform X1 n=1 Tax=Pomacea canaliculata TaxID=400727 RepID=UPI000D73ABA9|nr:sodium-dependent proline transporter-like isoform X1 [Pomacea canaliculata]